MARIKNRWVQNIKKIVEEDLHPSKYNFIHTAHSVVKVYAPTGDFLYAIDPLTRKKIRKNASLKTKTFDHCYSVEWPDESPIVGIDDDLWTKLEADVGMAGVDLALK